MFNYQLFDGEQVIHPEDLTELDPSEMLVLSGFRKEDKLIPVFTLTIYFGSDPWDGPLCLHDMMELRDPRMKQHIQNYRLNLIEPSTLSKDELQKFQTSFREVMGYIKYSKNADELLAFTKDNPRMLLEVSAARVIGTMTGTNISYEEAKEGRIDMCKAIEDLMRTSEEQGHIEGHIEGKRDGRNEERAKILASLVKLVKEGRMRAEDVAETLEVPLEEVLAAAGASEAKMPE